VPNTERETRSVFGTKDICFHYFHWEGLMNNVAIITDSTALPAEKVKEFGIHVVPLSVIWDEETFEDGIDITPTEFYDRLTASNTMPSTSQPSAARFKDLFTKLLDQGNDVLAILISSGISGTVNSALQALQEVDQNRVAVIDSQTAATATGLHVIAAARKAAHGASLLEVKEVALKSQQHTDVVFAVDTLEFLHKGGRIGGAKKFLGSMLNIKPILEIKDGVIEAADQVRTQKRALEKLISLIEEKNQDEKPLRIAVFHSNVPEIAQALLEDTKKKLNPEEIFLAELSPVIGTHVGPGTVAIACMHGM
jgi:DegV family protein with EDD domain